MNITKTIKPSELIKTKYTEIKDNHLVKKANTNNLKKK